MKEKVSPGGINIPFLWPLQMQQGNEEFILQIMDMFPMPVEIFSNDGTSVFTNRAFLELYKIPNANLIVGKYNILNDLVSNNQIDFRDSLRRAFHGERVSCPFPPLIHFFIESGIIKRKPFESAIMDAQFYPIQKNGGIIFIVCVFAIKNIYQVDSDVTRVLDYIDGHWKEEFDPRSLAKSADISVTHLYRLFRKHTGMTPGNYYRRCKVDHIKESLKDRNLSVKKAFKACGADSRGVYSRIFRELTGLSPAQFREKVTVTV